MNGLMRSLKMLVLGVVGVGVLTMGALPVRAQYSDIEDNPLVPVVSEVYGFETIQTVTVMQNVAEADDLLVTLFLARASGEDPVALNEMRKKGRSWKELFLRTKVSPEVLYQDLVGVKIPNRYPDYVWAQRRYREWKANPQVGLPLYDKTVRLLVGLNFVVRRFDMSPLDAMQARSGMASYVQLIEKKLGTPPSR
ncbi:MAG: hypothetical protein ACOX9B_01240 [Candidatus Xenobium sp.]|jgi:hypothetical protein|nr:hypothetical protein [Burkholderiales bacterium]